MNTNILNKLLLSTLLLTLSSNQVFSSNTKEQVTEERDQDHRTSSTPIEEDDDLVINTLRDSDLDYERPDLVSEVQLIEMREDFQASIVRLEKRMQILQEEKELQTMQLFELQSSNAHLNQIIKSLQASSEADQPHNNVPPHLALNYIINTGERDDRLDANRQREIHEISEKKNTDSSLSFLCDLSVKSEIQKNIDYYTSISNWIWHAVTSGKSKCDYEAATFKCLSIVETSLKFLVLERLTAGKFEEAVSVANSFKELSSNVINSYTWGSAKDHLRSIIPSLEFYIIQKSYNSCDLSVKSEIQKNIDYYTSISNWIWHAVTAGKSTCDYEAATLRCLSMVETSLKFLVLERLTAGKFEEAVSVANSFKELSSNIKNSYTWGSTKDHLRSIIPSLESYIIQQSCNFFQMLFHANQLDKAYMLATSYSIINQHLSLEWIKIIQKTSV